MIQHGPTRPSTSVAPVDAPDSRTSAADEIELLLGRMRGGDREAAAEFITRYGSRLRRRIRGKLSPAMRRIFDSQEIMSTVGRRLDLYVRDGRLEAGNVAQLWALVFRIAERAVIDKARIFRRLEEAESEDSGFARDLSQRLHQAQQRDTTGVEIEIEIEKALNLFRDRTDRQILSLWLVGTRADDIGTFVELSPVAVRQRWMKIKATLQRRFAA